MLRELDGNSVPYRQTRRIHHDVDVSPTPASVRVAQLWPLSGWPSCGGPTVASVWVAFVRVAQLWPLSGWPNCGLCPGDPAVVAQLWPLSGWPNCGLCPCGPTATALPVRPEDWTCCPGRRQTKQSSLPSPSPRFLLDSGIPPSSHRSFTSHDPTDPAAFRSATEGRQ